MIRLENLTKSFQTKNGRHYLFRDLSLEIPDTASVGFLGRNGAGKTTLLRILAGSDQPDSGRIVSNSSISWPVGLSGGFQGSLTGRENVRFVCRLYSSARYIDEKIDFVQNFADIGDYFDMPVKSYSSGIRSRLTFGLSTAFDFVYYIVDEVSAVGDAAFRKRSQAVMDKRRAQSGFLVVSHNLGEIKRQCDIGLVIMDGDAHIYHDINEAIAVYKAHINAQKT